MSMDKPTPEVRAMLDACILTGHRDNLGNRGSQMDDSGRTVCGVPRNPKRRKRAPVTMFDAHYTWQG